MALTINNPRYGNIFVVADTFAELRTVSTKQINDGYSAIVAGDLVPGDGFGGMLAWNAKSVAPDDSRTIIAPLDGQAGRWIKIAVGQVGPQGSSITGPQGAQGSPGPQGQGLADVMAPTGAALVGYKGAVSAAAPRTVSSKLSDSISIKDFGAKGDGSTDDYGAFAAAITYYSTQFNATGGATPTLHIPNGIYVFSQTITFNVQNMQIRCDTGVQFKHTGTGVALFFDGGTSSDAGDLYRVHFLGRPSILGNANTTIGVYCRGTHHCEFEFDVANVNDTGLRIEFAVCSTFKVRVTGLGRGGQNPQPKYGMILDGRNQYEDVTACTFINPILEQVSKIGLRLVRAGGNTFLGGTTEANGEGNLSIDGSCAQNKFLGVQMEFSGVLGDPAIGYDVSCYGSRNLFLNCYGDKRLSIYGNLNTVIGGLFDQITVSGDGNIFQGVYYGAQGGDFTIVGTNTYKTACFNQNLNKLDEDKYYVPFNSWLTDHTGNERLYFGAGHNMSKSPNGQLIVRNGADQECSFIGSTTGFQSDSVIRLNGIQVLKSQQPAVSNTSGATLVLLESEVNKLKAMLRTHGLIAT